VSEYLGTTLRADVAIIGNIERTGDVAQWFYEAMAENRAIEIQIGPYKCEARMTGLFRESMRSPDFKEISFQVLQVFE
jgi:hypothetical protein